MQQALTPQQERMVEENMNLITHVLKRYARDSRYEWDDAFQYGAMGLVDAVRTFDPNKGYAFSSYACKCIFRSINKWVVYNTRKKNSFGRNTIHTSLDWRNPLVRESRELYECLIPADYVPLDDAYCRKELIQLLKQYITTFPIEAQMALWNVSILHSRTAKQMAEELGMETYALQLMIKKYMRMLRIYAQRDLRRYV